MFFGCKSKEEENEAFTVFCEMVANGVKPMALSLPLSRDDADDIWSDYQEIANAYNVQIFREDNFPVTPLFPADATRDLSVIIIYRGDRLTQYRQLKKDITEKPLLERDRSFSYARRLGRLLGYDNMGINSLIAKNADYKTLSDFQVSRQITHLYYDDPVAALDFYQNILGLRKLDSATFYVGKDALIRINKVNEKHPSGQEKSTAIAFLTDQLAEWYEHINRNLVPVKYTYKPKTGGAHDGFVAIDPGGYLLEFEQFKQHPENELFMASLAAANPVKTAIDKLEFYGSITWTYHNDLLLMQDFYENKLGYQLVADQGWTKIYQTTGTAFIGLVDACRGMENYADEKAVEIEWSLEDEKTFSDYASKYWQELQYEDYLMKGPEKYIYRVSE